MKQRINFKTIYLIATITVGLLGLAIGSTMAIFTTSAEINNPISLSTTLTSDDDVFDVIDIVIEPYDTITKTIKIVNSSNSTVNFAIWYLNNFSDNSVDFGINGVPSGTLNVSSNESRIVNIRNKTSNQITITIGVASSKKSITLADSMVIYPNQTLPENIINQQAAKYITNLYETSTKTTVTNNSINYNYAISKSLMNDRKGSSSIGIDSGNIRYYGADPNNYVYFNCSTYPTTNCELWRIIGTFGDKIKIVRNESIGKYSWDNKDKTTGAETNYGKNDWTDARLMKLLNPGYESETGGSLYYNAKSGTCYVNQNNATTACNFTSTGIKNDTTKNIIAEVTYNTAGYNDATLYPNEIYTYERGSTVYSGRQTTWTGKIGLMYPSDYGYASDLTKCREKINNYNASTCSQNNWIYNMGSLWLLTHDSARSDRNWSINSSGNASVNGNGNGGTSNGLLVFPSLFLSSDVKIISGNGSINNPYQLGV